ncbi:prolyl oligopeptidase family serine peptidase [Amycolatopsis jejuensis]|uniref:prolyl oligopeptidase family serine peptidase n=1 Tax=Amycolatopsis jejuensis TaxID=330084 RepID=UPI0005254131|nr:prolyl oligopeptidase family serine peptidase [Amycolatopsis jejuensis]
MSNIEVPKTRTGDDLDEVAGVEFADPYRWLEEDTDEVNAWQDAQGEAATRYVRDWPHFDRLRELVGRYDWGDDNERFGSVPLFAAGQWFRIEPVPGAMHSRAVVAGEPYGTGRVVFDPASENAERPPFLSWISPSPDGRVLAVGGCLDGSERNRIRLVATATGELLPEPPAEFLKDNWTGGAKWLPDSSGFFYTATDDDPVSATHRVLLHLRRGAPSTVEVETPWLPGGDYRAVVASADGRHAVAVQGLFDPIPVAVAELADPAALGWRPFVTDASLNLPGYLLGDEWIAVSDIDAPRGRVVAIGLDSADPSDPGSWRTMVPESDNVVRAVRPVGEFVYVHEFVDTYAGLRIVDRNGRPCGNVPLPGKGALGERPFTLMNLLDPVPEEQLVFAFSTLTSSWGTFRHRPGAALVETVREPEVTMENCVVEDGWATSADGARVPYHLVRRRDVLLNEPRPALLWGYGGFGAPWLPQFPGSLAAFVDSGGTLVHTHLRGGTELGREWWEGGRLQAKENGYADLYAIAENLIATGVTTRDLLAVTGVSNGGLLCGVAATQRPGLFRAVVPRVPLLDLIGACRDGYDRWVIDAEFAHVDDPAEVRRLAGFSPYHLVDDDTAYPAVFIEAGDTDPRCPPWHARKFAARLQAAGGNESPVLLHIWRNSGHGFANDRKTLLSQETEWLAFVEKTLGMVPPG